MTMKKEEYEVRSARMEDIDALVFIDHASFSIPWSKESLQTFVQDGLHRDCFVAVITEAPKRIIGYVAIQFVADEAEISNIAVCPDARGRGAGRAMLEKAVDSLFERGVEAIFLEVRESNAAAKKLYESCGFEPVGRRKDYYSNPLEDALLYCKRMKVVNPY